MQALQGLTEELGHMSLIVVWCEFGPTIVHINAGTAPSALNLRQGTQFSLTGSASGRVFSAFADVADLKERIDAEFQGNGEHHGIGQIASRQAFDDDVAHVRKLGYAVADSVPIPGVNAVAAPVFSAAGHLELVITLIGPSQLLAIGPDSTAVVRLLQTAKAIEQSVIRHVAHETA